ncbi:DUF342 domain-containing protein [Aliidiomarina soli]|uniref:Flagellar Assembly Protein A N-terminal region domain-containing protein n=1 Tax=Aliidiomarina soli TaxID=1928574 RepID=A0A432WC62_9GAMM|nr:FapA family protein [Aliidiomarina soli]RUO29643.1 hypothetical protein CWE14_14395 [Aliidiomarina soli]
MKGIDFVLTDQNLYLSLDSTAERASLNSKALDTLFQQSDMRHCVLDDNAFINACQQLAENDDSLIRIGQCLPASITLQLSEDQMQAHAEVVAPQGGAALTMNQILKTLRAEGITAGIRRQAMEKLVLHSMNGEPGTSLTLLIARGRPPIDGDDARFEALTMDARERVLQPQEVDGNKVDMRDLGEIISVEPGTPLLRKISPTPGSPGFTVKGVATPPIPGKNRDLHAGNGTEVKPDDPMILVAARQGLPRLIDNAAHVDDVLTMRKVDATTGHVSYEGSVIVNGNVGPGMKVVAGGDVTVSGYVDSAIIEAGGNVTITKGVIGQQSEVHDEGHEVSDVPEHSAQVTAKGSLWVSYSQYATLHGETGVIVDKQLTHCHVVSGGSICLGGEGKEARGKLIGGTVDAANHIYAGQIGAPAGTKTHVVLQSPKADPEYLADKSRLASELKAELVLIKRFSRARDRARYRLEAAPLKKFLHTLDQKLENHRRNATVLRIQIQELQKRAPERQMIVVHANRVLYSGVVFHSDYETKRIDENRGPSSLILKNGSFSYQYVG